MAEDFDDRLRRHEEMMQGLARVWMRQGETNERLEAFVEEQRAMNQHLDGYMARLDGFMQQQVAFNGDLTTTLADIKTLLARLPRGEHNGHDA